MSALARWFNANGYAVAGYDRSRTQLCMELEVEGMNVHYEDSIDLVPEKFKEKNTLIVFTPAIPFDHKELSYFRNNGFSVVKRAEVLGMLTKDYFTIAVAGTHGKTTTSSMIAHILRSCNKNCFAFLGGITQNYKSNLLLGDKAGNDQIMVVEADEYDRSFLKLNPSIAVITAMDPDHLDIYKDEKDFTETFNAFVKQINPGGALFHKSGTVIDIPNKGQKHYTFGTDNNDYNVDNYRVENGDIIFDLNARGKKFSSVKLQVPGMHNVMNATAAFAASAEAGVEPDKIIKALYEFKGVKRRFDVIYKGEKTVYIDDYAHHPTEITAFLSAVRDLYEGKKVTAVFQPHLFSRTRDFMDEFARSLELADKVILLDIYPAREKPIDGITSNELLEKINIKDKNHCSKDELLVMLDKTKTDILVTIGAGDIDQFIDPIKKLLESKNA